MKLAHIERVKLVEGLDREASRTYRLWESAGHVLKEFQLDQKQIEQLFAQVEKDATAAGTNRTALGKGIDTTTAAGKAVKQAYDDLVDKVQNSGPMQNMDAAYDQAAEKLKQATGGDQGVMKYVQKYRDFAEKHPVAQSFIYAALIAAAGISGAGLGGAAVLGLLKMTDQLLQGKKFSTALGKGAMTGATAYAASNILGGGDLPSDPNAPGYQVGAEGPASAPGQFDVSPETSQNFGLTPGGVDANATQDAIDAAAKTAADAGKEGAKSAASTAATNRAGQVAADTATNVAQGAGVEIFPGLATDQMANNAIKQIADKIAAGTLTDNDLTFLDSTKQFVAAQISDQGYQTAPKELWDHYNVLDAMVRKAVEMPKLQESRTRYIDADATIRHWALNESLGRKRGGIRLTEAGVNRVFASVEAQALNEGIMDTLKGAAGKVGGAIKGAAGKAGAAIAQTGKNLTNKITADKLKKAWEFEGGNTDSEAIKIFLKQQGVDPAVIDGAMQSVGVKSTPASKGPAAAGASQFVKDLVAGYMALTAAERAEIMKELDIAIDVSGNSNLVKGMNESKRRKKAVK